MRVKRHISWIMCIALFITLFSIWGCTKETENTPSPTPALTITPTPSESTKGQSEVSNTNENKFGKLVLVNDIKRVVNVPYSPLKYETSIKPYKVNDDLSNIENLDQFGSFSRGQKELLSKNAFVVSPGEEEQLFYIYEKNDYNLLPSFVTTDSVLQIYHIFYDYSLRNLEAEKLLSIIEELTGSMLRKSILLYKSINNPVVKEAAAKNCAYFATAQLALKKELPEDLPSDIKILAEKEYALIEKEGSFEKSGIFPFMLDYSQFTPRGHYTRDDDFKRYFKTLMWFGQAPFPLYRDKEQKERDVEQTLQALLITYSVFLDKEGTPDIELWEKVYEPTVFYVGKADDLSLYNYKDLMIKTYGQNPDIEKLNDKDKIDVLYKEAEKLPEPKIKAEYTEVDTPVGKQFRFMGQRYIPDSEIIQELVEPMLRPIPSGLDVIGVLGSDRAYEIQKAKEENQWEGYPEAFERMRNTFLKIGDESWRSNMYSGWLWTLKSFTKVFGSGYPSFMTNNAWIDRSLSTGLGSWSELRHDTILYGKQSGAEKGGGAIPLVMGYVEPQVEVYEKLLWLTKYSRENLAARQILPDNVKSAMERFEELLSFLIDCSVKELKAERLSDDAYQRLQSYGAILEDLTSSLAADGLRWFEITSETDKNMSIISDFHTIAPNKYSGGGYMEAGVGPAYEMYVVVPIEGKLYLTRGAVFSYYEFENNSDKRLTDEEWQRMLNEDKNPPQPEWTQSFIRGGKGEIPEPKQWW